MNINGNFGNMPFYGNMPNYGNQSFHSNMPAQGNHAHFQIPYPMPRIIDDCGPKGGIIPNFHGPVGADTINFFGKTGPDVINYHGIHQAKTYTMQSYNCPPGVYNIVDVNWNQPKFPQPIYHPMPIHGGKGCATC